MRRPNKRNVLATTALQRTTARPIIGAAHVAVCSPAVHNHGHDRQRQPRLGKQQCSVSAGAQSARPRSTRQSRGKAATQSSTLSSNAKATRACMCTVRVRGKHWKSEPGAHAQEVRSRHCTRTGPPVRTGDLCLAERVRRLRARARAAAVREGRGEVHDRDLRERCLHTPVCKGGQVQKISGCTSTTGAELN